MIVDKLEYVEFNGDCIFFCFRLEIYRFFGPKIQNCQFKLKLGT